MPPKSTRKASSAKRSSPRGKRPTPELPTPVPLPPVAEETADDPAAKIPAAAVESKEEAPAADAMEEAPTEEDADDDPPVAEETADDPAAAVESKEEAPVAATAAADTMVEAPAEEDTDDKLLDEKIAEGIVVEKIVEETMVEKIEEEMTVVEEVAVEKVLDSSEAAPMEAARKGKDKGASGKKDATEAEVKDEERQEEGEEEEEDQEEEEGESEDEEEGEGNKQIVQEETGEGEIESISGDDRENDEDDPAIYMQAPLSERKKQKDFEIFIGGLDKGAVDEDLIKVFGVFGEIQSVRIVKHPVTQKSKGFAFVRYANIEHTKKALAELKDGTEVKGKKIRVSASQDNDTLYLGNICKTWTKDNVLETLKGYGVEQIEDILLPDDPKNEGKIRGFAFLEFKSHSDAMTAFQRLRKPDAVFGRNISAKVAFAQAPLHPCEEDLLKVKTVYMEGIPKSWDESKVEELCKQYGEIEKIQLSKNFTSSKRKDFGFVEFLSRDGAVACVEGINNTQLEEDVNVKANLAKPMYKGRLAKQSRGGYKIQKNVEATEEAGKSKKKKKAKSNAVHDKNETQPSLKSSNKNMPSKSQDKNLKEKKASQTVQSAKGQKRGRKGTDIAVNQQPPQKARKTHNYGRRHGRHSTGFSNPRSSYSSNPYVPRPTTYAPPATSYTAHAYPGASGSQHRRTDLEPHAGYLPAANQVRHPYVYDGRSRSGAYGFQPRSSSGYVGAPSVQSSYPGYSSYAGHEASYTYPSSGARAYQRPYY